MGPSTYIPVPRGPIGGFEYDSQRRLWLAQLQLCGYPHNQMDGYPLAHVSGVGGYIRTFLEHGWLSHAKLDGGGVESRFVLE